MNQMTSTAEVMQMVFLFIELFLPTRNFLFIFHWYQYLQMRYLQDRNGCLKAAFKNLDSQVMTLLNYSFIPGIIRTGYGKFKEFLQKQAPVPGQTRPSMLPSMPKCTIS
jgi:hypothetical protein